MQLTAVDVIYGGKPLVRTDALCVINGNDRVCLYCGRRTESFGHKIPS